MAGRVEGKVALITGAARGQGRSHAIRLAQEGADIIAVDMCAQIESVPYPLAQPRDLEETVAAVEALDRRIVSARADVRDGPGLRAVLDDAVAELGKLDIVCANAGILSVGTVAELPAQAWKDMIDVNLTGAFNTVQAAIPHLIAAGGGGSIIITSSSLALRAAGNLSHYNSAKDGLIGLMRTAALELAPHFIRVNTIHPTTVDTDMIQNQMNYKLFMPEADNPTRDEVVPAYKTLNALPIPWVDPIDISNAVLFLASDEARYITGITMPVDAGFALI